MVPSTINRTKQIDVGKGKFEPRTFFLNNRKRRTRFGKNKNKIRDIIYSLPGSVEPNIRNIFPNNNNNNNSNNNNDSFPNMNCHNIMHIIQHYCLKKVRHPRRPFSFQHQLDFSWKHGDTLEIPREN